MKQSRTKPWQTNNNTTPQTKWHSHKLDTLKITNLVQQLQNTERL